MLSATLVACDSRRTDYLDDLVDGAVDGEPAPDPMAGHLLGPALRGADAPRHEQRNVGDIDRRFLRIFRREV